MTEINSDLPFLAEYAKSGRASCKACKTVIGKGDLRMAAMVQVGRFRAVPHLIYSSLEISAGIHVLLLLAVANV